MAHIRDHRLYQRRWAGSVAPAGPIPCCHELQLPQQRAYAGSACNRLAVGHILKL